MAVLAGGTLIGVDSALARVTLTSLDADNSQTIIEFDASEPDPVVEIVAAPGRSSVTLSGVGGNTCYVRVRGGSIVVSSPIVVDLQHGDNGTKGTSDRWCNLGFTPPTAGKPGQSAPSLKLETIPAYRVGENLDIVISNSINLDGTNGGSGGDGSNAYRCPTLATAGAAGAMGGAGGSLLVLSSGDITVNGTLSASGGNGGHGGDGGVGLVVNCWQSNPLWRYAMDAASAGNGGASGAGGTITLDNANARICNSISIAGSLSAQSGNSGHGGEGGDLDADPLEGVYEIIGDCNCDLGIDSSDLSSPNYPCGVAGDGGWRGTPLDTGRITIAGYNIGLLNASLRTDAGSVGAGGAGGDGCEGGNGDSPTPHPAGQFGGNVEIISYHGSDISLVGSSISTKGGTGGSGGDAGSGGAENGLFFEEVLPAGLRGSGANGGGGGLIEFDSNGSTSFDLIVHNSSIRSNGGNGGRGGDAALGVAPAPAGGGGGNGGNGGIIDIGAQAVFTCNATIGSDGGNGGSGDPAGFDGSGGTIVAPTYTQDCAAQPGTLVIIGDMNCDGVVDSSDISPFSHAIQNPESYLQRHTACCIEAGDCSGDGIVDSSDTNCFIDLVYGN